MEMFKAPPFLIVHLKRFSHKGGMFGSRKISDLIDFPVKGLDISSYTNTDVNAPSVELAELTSIELLQVDLLISWGMPPREQSWKFSTVRAVLADQGLPR